MRKQELIHIHGLLVEVRRYFDDRDEIPADAFDAYDTYGVTPTALHRHKDAHKEAIEHLLEGIDTTLTIESTVPKTSPVQPD